MKRDGEVFWFNEKKGFGFIRDADGEEYFVHYSEIMRKGFQTLAQGEKVRFDVSGEAQGKKAVSVEVVGEAE